MPDQISPGQPASDGATVDQPSLRQAEPEVAAEVAAELASEVEVDVDLAGFLPEGVAIDLGSTSDVEARDPADPDGVDRDLLDAVERDLDDVERALRSLDDGTYGSCLVCAAVIPEQLLAVDPVRRTCDAHA